MQNENEEAKTDGLPVPCWRVRVVMRGGALLHFVSRTKPEIRFVGCEIGEVVASFVEGSPHGDTIGFIDWTEAVAVSWRSVCCDENRGDGAGPEDLGPNVQNALDALLLVKENPRLTGRQYLEKWEADNPGRKGFWIVRKCFKASRDLGWIVRSFNDVGADFYEVTDEGRKALAERTF